MHWDSRRLDWTRLGRCEHPLTLESELDWTRLESVGVYTPLQAWNSPEGSRKLRFPNFMKTAQDGCKVVSHTYRPPLLPRNATGTHFY